MFLYMLKYVSTTLNFTSCLPGLSRQGLRSLPAGSTVSLPFLSGRLRTLLLVTRGVTSSEKNGKNTRTTERKYVRKSRKNNRSHGYDDDNHPNKPPPTKEPLLYPTTWAMFPKPATKRLTK